jgi:hypothetical protein
LAAARRVFRVPLAMSLLIQQPPNTMCLPEHPTAVGKKDGLQDGAQ